jgi:oxygen-independent coproporphyrinogen-3 oxidase
MTERRIVTQRELPFEFALNAFRLKSRLQAALFESRTGLPINTIQGALQTAERRHLLAGSLESGWHPTELGERFLNDLQSLFLAEAS